MPNLKYGLGTIYAEKAPKDAHCLRGLLQNDYQFVGWINGEPYTLKGVRTVRGRATGNLSP